MPAAAPSASAPTGVTLYLQLASLWRARMQAGEWKLGDRLPTVAQLAAQHGAAGVTVRHALRLLAQEGLVRSARGRGSFVCGTPAAPNASLRRAINDPQAGARAFSIELQKRSRAAAPPAELLGDSECVAEGYVVFDKRHLLDGQPFCAMRLYVADDVYRSFPPRSERQHKINGLLLAHSPERAALFQTTITMASADAQTGPPLALPFGAPVVRIVRRVLDPQGLVVYAGLFWYRGDRFVLDIDLPADAMRGRPDWLTPQAAR